MGNELKRERATLDGDFARGFPAVVDDRARCLVLGSLPGRYSLRVHEYYGLPRNAFWPIIGELFAAGPDVPYEQRLQRLSGHGVALWDVLAASRRPGSLDADIEVATAECNDFVSLFDRYPSISEIFFNGQKAEQLFRRRVWPVLGEERIARMGFHLLPSTSPAHAAMGFHEKLSRWSVVKKLCTVRK